MQAPTDRYHLAFWGLVAAFVALALVPLATVDVLPFLDAGQHLRVAAILQRWDATPAYAAAFERLGVPTPYFLWYRLVGLLAPLLGVEGAARAVIALSLAALPLAAIVLLRQARHSRWLVLAVLPWMWNADVMWGYFHVALALPLFIAMLAAHLSLVRAPALWKAVVVSVLVSLLAVTHYAFWLAGLVLLPGLAAVFGARSHWSRALLWPMREVACIAPSVALLLPWAQRSVDIASFGSQWRDAFAVEAQLPLTALRAAVDRMFDQFQPHPKHLEAMADLWLRRPGDMLSAVWLGALALWVLGTVRQGQREAAELELADASEPHDTADNLGARYLGIATAGLAVLYFVLPRQVLRPLWLFNVNVRLVEAIAIVGVCALPLRVLAPPPQARKRTWAGTIAFGVVAAGVPILALQAVTLGSAEYDRMRDAFRSIPNGSSVLTLHGQAGSAWLRQPTFTNLGEWWDVAGSGYVPQAFADPMLQPLRLRSRAARPQPLGDDHGTFSFEEHGRFYDYIATWHDPFAAPPPFAGELRALPVVYARGRWQVYRVPNPTPWPPPPPLTAAELATVPHAERCLWAKLGLTPLGPVDNATAAPSPGLLDALRCLEAAHPFASDPARAADPSQPEERPPGMLAPMPLRHAPRGLVDMPRLLRLPEPEAAPPAAPGWAPGPAEPPVPKQASVLH
ncbi:MAG: hypothetical protein EXR79_00985 [Myxococcales bacterium]|nr:hypothetical protein [Myxococcales bacterium]